MRRLVKDYVGIVARTLPIGEPIYEFGSLPPPGQEGFADLRSYFPGRRFVGCDMTPGPGVDLVMDLHKIDLPPQAAGTVLLLDTLEHVEHFWTAMAEIFRLIRPGGVLVISSVMNYPIHKAPSDYWRFSPDAFETLLKPFDWRRVDFVGLSSFPHSVLGVAVKGKLPQESVQRFEEEVQAWKRRWNKSWRYTALKLVPPLVVDLYKLARLGLEKRGIRILPRIKV